jgi:gluconokinase
MRAVVEAGAEADNIKIPDGLFCYRVDPKRFVLGGALSSGGEVFAWMKRTLRLPDSGACGQNNEAIEQQLAALPAAQHGLTILPLFAGERSTGWRSEARAAIAGLGANTSPIEILQAAHESVALRFRNVYELMESSIGAPREIAASGTALLHSAVWTQMMADTLSHAIIRCVEPEATSRGALIALERLPVTRNAVTRNAATQYGSLIQPIEKNGVLYMAELERQRRLYGQLFEENP